MEKIDVIVLAGGEGTRLRNVIADIPKPLAPINGRPFLDILLSQLSRFDDINKVVLAVGYKAEMILDRYGGCPDYNFEIVFSIEKKLLGTGGAIKQAISFTGTDDIIVLNGDTYVEISFDDLFMFHRNRNAFVTVVLKEVDNVRRYGNVRIDNKNKVLLFEEKQNTNKQGLINAGVYLVKKSCFDNVEPSKVISFEREILPELVEKDRVYGFVVNGKFIDIGIPETYKEAPEYLKEVT